MQISYQTQISSNPHPEISDGAFRKIQRMFLQESGILLAPSKKSLVTNRLTQHLGKLGLEEFDTYCQVLQNHDGVEERRVMVELLTTNETYFFREPLHFQHMCDVVLPAMKRRPMRVWCAAASTGEEPYSIAMTLSDKAKQSSWDVLGTDLNRKVLENARCGIYVSERLHNMPEGYLERFCMRGTGNFEGKFRVRKTIRDRVRLGEHNLLHSAARLGQFDLVFLRNVLIYFRPEMKKRVASHVVRTLRPGGWLYIGGAESLHGFDLPLQMLRPSIYRKL